MSGVVAGRVLAVKSHPNADRIRLALVDLGAGEPVQIVFGGPDNVHAGDLVPVAPPGSRLPNTIHKMRRRSYRGESSYGMLCSLAELGWNPQAPDEVALLHNVAPGDSLDKLMTMDWKSFVINTAGISNPKPISPLLVSIAENRIPQRVPGPEFESPIQVISSTTATRPPAGTTRTVPSGSVTP